jgi:malate/lactate dehydrogenase
MRANTVQTNAEAVAEMKNPGTSYAVGAAALRVAEFVLWLFSSYLVYCFGLARKTFELSKENEPCRSAVFTS